MKAPEKVGYLLGTNHFDAEGQLVRAATPAPNPRITIATENAPATEKALRARGVVISDVAVDEFYVSLSLIARAQALVLFAGMKFPGR